MKLLPSFRASSILQETVVRYLYYVMWEGNEESKPKVYAVYDETDTHVMTEVIVGPEEQLGEHQPIKKDVLTRYLLYNRAWDITAGYLLSR